MDSLGDHVVFVTGATSGIGAAVARRFTTDGARVVITGRRKDRLDALRAELGPRCHAIAFDVGDRAAVTAAFESLPPEFAEVTILVNNAGNAIGKDLVQNGDLDDWDRMIDTNCRGVIYCTRAVLPGMVARDRGHIFNLGSVAGNHKGPAGTAVYAGTKSFVSMFSYNLRADLLGSQVHVTVVSPGNAETEFAIVQEKDEARGRSRYQGFKTMKGEDVAELIRSIVALPAHMNVNEVEVMPLMQAFGPRLFHKST
jgi:3-hydroxy acid dehydrogenase/malonic semialdehyde reductase